MRSRTRVVGFALAATVALAPGVTRAATSHNVVIIGGTALSPTCTTSTAANVHGFTGGGCVVLTGASFAPYVFTPMRAADVNAASLAPFDTAVLVMASNDLRCGRAPAALSAQAQADLLAFVGSGKKLIIHDSECAPGPNYAWLPYPFTTNNPGALGANGTLTITENSTLGSSVAGPNFLDANYLGAQIDAVGDMNVMTTQDSHWRVALSGTNVNGVTGAVHTYAFYPAGVDHGLIIYNGLDEDYARYEYLYGYGGGASLAGSGVTKVWLLELGQEFAPSGLQGAGPSPTGITLSPDAVSRDVGTTHTVTARLANLLNQPKAGLLVTFTVGGANAAAAGTCVPADCTSDVTGTVTYSYVGAAAGSDTVTASFTDALGTHDAVVTVAWQQPPQVDTTPPSCGTPVVDVDPATGRRRVQITVQDTGSGLASVTAGAGMLNAEIVTVSTTSPTDPALVTVLKIDQTLPGRVELDVTDVAGNAVTCDPPLAAEAAAPAPEAKMAGGCRSGPAGLASLLGLALAAGLLRRRSR